MSVGELSCGFFEYGRETMPENETYSVIGFTLTQPPGYVNLITDYLLN